MFLAILSVVGTLAGVGIGIWKIFVKSTAEKAGIAEANAAMSEHAVQDAETRQKIETEVGRDSDADVARELHDDWTRK